ncbi:MAG: polyribonucleotide nucleotidyltransferase, partial [Brachymonas sp.]
MLNEFTLQKGERDARLEAIKDQLNTTIQSLADDHPVRQALSGNAKLLGNSYKGLTKKFMRQQILTDGKRVDGRKLDEVRPISAAVAVLPRRVH